MASGKARERRLHPFERGRDEAPFAPAAFHAAGEGDARRVAEVGAEAVEVGLGARASKWIATRSPAAASWRACAAMAAGFLWQRRM